MVWGSPVSKALVHGRCQLGSKRVIFIELPEKGSKHNSEETFISTRKQLIIFIEKVHLDFHSLKVVYRR